MINKARQDRLVKQFRKRYLHAWITSLEDDAELTEAIDAIFGGCQTLIKF
ncbi:hypothetical protein [Aphanothece hegewaldii]|nr:hypothetical protein [Aphanothece hegewaldii]